MEGTPGSCLFASCRWLCWPLGACSEVPRPLDVFYCSDPVICSLLPPHAPTFPLLTLSLSLSAVLPSTVPFFFVSRYSASVTHFLPLYQELIPSCLCSFKSVFGVCWLEGIVQVNTACVSTWLLASGHLVKQSCLVNYRVTTTVCVTDFPASGLAQWHENKLKLSQMRSFGLFPDCSNKQARRQLVPTSWSLIRRSHPLRICLSHFEIQVVKMHFVHCKNRFSSTCVSRFQAAAL